MKKRNRPIIIWLYSGCALVFLMVIIGGITRLTGSGLSITEWKVVTGTLPPMNEAQWSSEFSKYQASPQFQKVNSHFQLHDFKTIYWWEYIHRLVARLMSVVFIIPLLWFLYKRKIQADLIPKLFIIILLGAWQGFLGWYMVKSGLVNNPHVSHLRLAMHLVNAFITFGYIFWVALDLQYYKDTLTSKRPKTRATEVTIGLLIIVLVQIIYGAFVAGLKAGYVYNTWPLMDGQIIADSVFKAFNYDGIFSLVNNLATVQFIHRTLALIIFFGIVWFWFNRHHESFSLKAEQKQGVISCMLIVLLQVVLGICTLIFHMPIALAIIHQATAFLLFGSFIFLWHRLRFA